MPDDAPIRPRPLTPVERNRRSREARRALLEAWRAALERIARGDDGSWWEARRTARAALEGEDAE